MARGRDRRRETRILPLTVRLADVPPEFKSELFDGMRDAGLDVATLPADTVDAETPTETARAPEAEPSGPTVTSARTSRRRCS